MAPATTFPWLSLIDGVVVFGVLVVLPLAVGGPLRWWLLSTATVVVAFWLPEGGLAAIAVVPFVAVTVGAVLSRARSLLGRVRDGGGTRRTVPPGLVDLVGLVADAGACLYAFVAAVGLLVSRAGANPFGIHEPIVELTAVHYIFAGTAALVLAGRTLDRHPRVGTVGVGLTMAAPPVVAIGFVTGAMLPQVGGAVLMALGVFVTAALELRSAASGALPARLRALLVVSGLAIWVPMVLAVGWAAGQHWDIPVLSIDEMARTHGLANAIGFVLCGLLARRWEEATP